MPRCKICQADVDRRADIEKRLLSGRTPQYLAKDLEALNFKVTAAQLKTHFTRHMTTETASEPETAKMVVLEPSIPVEELLSRLNKDLHHRDYNQAALENRLKAGLLLDEISLMNLVIVREEMKKYCEGLAPYPSEQIRGLRILHNILSELPSYSDRTHLYEIDRISEQARKLKIN